MTYTVNIARSRLPLRIPIAAIRNLGKRRRDVRVQPGALGKVELVAVGVRVGAAGMARLGAAGDDDGAAARALEGDGALDRRRVDALVRRARGPGRVGAAAAGARGDAGGLQLRLRLGLGELGAVDRGGGEGSDEGEGLC